MRDPYRPLGEVRAGGAVVAHEPIAAPWGDRRACVHVDGDGPARRPRRARPRPPGDLVLAGPAAGARRRARSIDGADREGFSAGSAQFDSDITAARHPRCALGVGDDELLAVCCDGRRSGVDAGLELAELARLLISFGARDAINLDGGGSATLVHRGHLLNRPVLGRGPAGARVAAHRHRAAVRAGLNGVQATLVRVLVVATSVLLVAAALTSYAWRALFDSDRFVDRATAALQDPSVRDADRRPGHRRARAARSSPTC